MTKLCSHCSHPVDAHTLRREFTPGAIYVIVCARCVRDCATSTLSEIVTAVLESKSMVLA